MEEILEKGSCRKNLGLGVEEAKEPEERKV